jgi:hypothetical protein
MDASNRDYSASFCGADLLAKAPVEENGYFPRDIAGRAFSCPLGQFLEAEEIFGKVEPDSYHS